MEGEGDPVESGSVETQSTFVREDQEVSVDEAPQREESKDLVRIHVVLVGEEAGPHFAQASGGCGSL